MNAHRVVEVLLLEILVASIIFSMMPLVSSGYKERVTSENSPSNRVLYLNDSWNDAPNDLRTSTYAFAEIKKVEVEEDAIIITAKSTMRGVTRASYYFIFFDTNLDNKTDICWGRGSTLGPSLLYRYSDKAFYYNGSWHPNISSAQAKEFDGTLSENATTGETTTHLCGVINGTMKIKVASMTRYSANTASGPWEGDLVPGGNFLDGSKLLIQPPYKNISDTAFPYGNTTLELEAGVLPPPPPPSPPEVRLNLFVQMAVWGMQAAVWFKEGVINLPFWIRDNAVSGSLIFTVLLLSSYSFVKKWRTNKQRLKKIRESLKQSV